MGAGSHINQCGLFTDGSPCRGQHHKHPPGLELSNSPGRSPVGARIVAWRILANLLARNWQQFCGPSLGESPAGQSVFRQEAHTAPHPPTCVGSWPSRQVRAAGSSQLLAEAPGEKEEEGALQAGSRQGKQRKLSADGKERRAKKERKEP